MRFFGSFRHRFLWVSVALRSITCLSHILLWLAPMYCPSLCAFSGWYHYHRNSRYSHSASTQSHLWSSEGGPGGGAIHGCWLFLSKSALAGSDGLPHAHSLESAPRPQLAPFSDESEREQDCLCGLMTYSPSSKKLTQEYLYCVLWTINLLMSYFIHNLEKRFGRAP